jgi:hypothetical protein
VAVQLPVQVLHKEGTMPNGNAVMPPADPAGGNALGMPNQSSMFSVENHVNDAWQKANVQHKQITDQVKRIDSVRRELERLAELGDTVTVEDVIRGAGTLVGTGFAPTAVAQLLSTMPTTGGQAMQAWVSQQSEKVQALEQQADQKYTDSAIHRGLAGMAVLHVKHIKGPPQAPQMPGSGEGEGEE